MPKIKLETEIWRSFDRRVFFINPRYFADGVRFKQPYDAVEFFGADNLSVWQQKLKCAHSRYQLSCPKIQRTDKNKTRTCNTIFAQDIDYFLIILSCVLTSLKELRYKKRKTKWKRISMTSNAVVVK